MRVYKLKVEGCRFPDDVCKISKYLEANGELFIPVEIVEELYEQFSDELYCAQWIIPNETRLNEFAHWLNNYDL